MLPSRRSSQRAIKALQPATETENTVKQVKYCCYQLWRYLGILPTNKVFQLHDLVIDTGAVSFFNQIVSWTLFCFHSPLPLGICQTTDRNLVRVQDNGNSSCKNTIGSLRECGLNLWLTQIYSSNDSSSRICLDNLWLEMSLKDTYDAMKMIPIQFLKYM